MKIPKGSWIGLGVTILWMVGVAFGLQYCNWNWVCSGAVRSGFCSSAWAAILYVPAILVTGSIQEIMKPFGWIFSDAGLLIVAGLIIMAFGMLLGAFVEKILRR